MLEHWFIPFSGDTNPDVDGRFGSAIEIFDGTSTDLKPVQLALVGLESKVADAIRQELYAFSYTFPGLKIADLGNLRKQDPSFIIPVLEELLNGQVLPVLFGGRDELALAQYLAYQHRKEPVSLLAIDNSLSYGDPGAERHALWETLVDQKGSHLFHAGMIGVQSHLTAEASLRAWDEAHFDSLRLGRIKSDIADAEPLIRDADLVFFHTAAIRRSEAPGQRYPVSSGLTTEEACQLSRYAGMSDKLSSIGFFGYVPSKDIRQQTAQVIAQLIWYFIDGVQHRKQDYPVSTAHLVEYIVHFKDPDHQLTFWKSNKSGRWWMQIPVKTKRRHQRHRLIPCSYSDYEMACREELPDRLIQAIKRF